MRQVALIRHTRTSGRAEERYTAATAVVVTEVLKFAMALVVVVYQRREKALRAGDRSGYLAHAGRAVGALVAPARGSNPFLMVVPSALCACGLSRCPIDRRRCVRCQAAGPS